jgi:hypothetical protein
MSARIIIAKGERNGMLVRGIGVVHACNATVCVSDTELA